MIEKGSDRRKRIRRTMGEWVSPCVVWLWDVAHQDCMDRDKKEVAYCRVDAQIDVSQIIMVSEGTITNANGKFWDRNLWDSKPLNEKKKFPQMSVYCIMSPLEPLFWNNVISFTHRGTKPFPLDSCHCEFFICICSSTFCYHIFLTAVHQFDSKPITFLSLFKQS